MDIKDVVKVTINVADTRITRAGFGVPLILDGVAGTVFPERVREYPDLESLAVDFAATTKVYKAAAAIFSQARTPQRAKVGRRDAGDASITAALDAIESEDADWYALLSAYKASADLQEIAAWIEARSKIFLASSEDADVLTAVDTDIAGVLQAASRNRSAYLWHHQAGVDASGASYVIASGVITVTQAGHGLKAGDPVTFSGSAGTSDIDGNNTVDTVPGADSFTCQTTAAEQAVGAAVDYFARYTFPEAAWAGLQLPTDPGSSTWKFKRLSGITPAPRTELNPTEEANALGKNANVYVPLAGMGAMVEGTMAGGRFIDVQRGIDWLEARLSEGITLRLQQEPKVPYSDAGMEVIRAEMAAVFDLGVRMGLLAPLLDSDSGELYRITIPKVAGQLQAERNARSVKGIKAQAQLAGAVHSLDITVNASV